MKYMAILVLMNIAMLAVAFLYEHHHSRGGPGTARVRYTFDFVVHGPYAKVFPLFGADKERVWGGSDWDPHFIYPTPAADVEGAVFTTRHGNTVVPWVNTRFDVKNGAVQYVYVIPNAMTTRIDIHVVPQDEQNTIVDVTYERTSLSASADDHVRSLGQHDVNNAKEWGEAIDKFLASAR